MKTKQEEKNKRVKVILVSVILTIKTESVFIKQPSFVSYSLASLI